MLWEGLDSFHYPTITLSLSLTLPLTLPELLLHSLQNDPTLGMIQEELIVALLHALVDGLIGLISCVAFVHVYYGL